MRRAPAAELIGVTLGAYSEITLGKIALVTFCFLTTLQISYLIGSALAEVPQAQRLSDRIPERRELLRTAQTAIGGELRAYFQPLPLNDVSPQLRNKLALLGIVDPSVRL